MIILMMIAALSFPIGQMTLKGTVLSQIPVDGSEPGNEDPSWDGGWTNIVPANHTGQTFIAKSSIFWSVEVAVLTTPNTSAKTDTISMKIFSEVGQVLTKVSKTVDSGFDGWLRFEVPGGGLQVVPGQKLIIRLEDTGRVLFGWKYGENKYPNGTAIMLGVEDPRFDFLFRINRSPNQVASSNPRTAEPIANTHQVLIPDATEPCPVEVTKWWQEIRAAAKDATDASQRKDQALREAWNRNQQRGKTDDKNDILPHKEREKFDADISEARTKYLDLLREGLEKSYRVPIRDNANPIFLYMGRPSYTRLAREKRINGTVIMQVEFRADGTIGEVKVVKGIGNGLDENAVKAIRKTIFLPAVKDGIFLTVTKSPQAEFDVR